MYLETDTMCVPTQVVEAFAILSDLPTRRLYDQQRDKRAIYIEYVYLSLNVYHPSIGSRCVCDTKRPADAPPLRPTPLYIYIRTHIYVYIHIFVTT